ASKLGGEQAAEDYAKSAFPASEGWTVTKGENANAFDFVAYNKNTKEVVIIEAKGGTSGLGDRYGPKGALANPNDPNAGKEHVQQGTVEYIKAVVEPLSKTDPSLAKKIIDQLG